MRSPAACNGMDQGEENKYVSQLKEVFNSCDTTGTGYLDKEELTDLCHKVHLDEQLPLLLTTLLGSNHFARVNFEEFKEGFVSVLSSTIDISISEDESSYLEPVIPEEVKPKFVKGTKRYGRRTRPEHQAAENEANKLLHEQHHLQSKRKSQLKRSSSLESVESLKTDEEAESAKEPQNGNLEAEGQLRAWSPENFESPRKNNSSPCSDMTEHQVRDIWEEVGISHNGYLNQQELAAVIKNVGIKDLSKKALEDLFTKLDTDGDGKVSFEEFQILLSSHYSLPMSSTPLKQRRLWSFYQSPEDVSHKTTMSSVLSSSGRVHLFTSIDDGAGFGNPEQIMVFWEDEGIEHSKDILMSLDFSLEDPVNLLDLTTALDNELIASKNRIHLAALASYKHELHHQHRQIEQIVIERDKAKQDLERAERRNMQLADEVDDHTSVMEQHNESKLRDLEQEYKQKLAVIRSELESEREQIVQQSNQERSKLEAEMANFQMEEAFLKTKLHLSVKENSRLQTEMAELAGKLSESESQVFILQSRVEDIKTLEDPQNAEYLNQEEKFAEIIKEYETQCRELRDQNDELQMQLEKFRSQNESKYSRFLAKMKDNKLLNHRPKEKIHNNQANHGANGKKGLSIKLRRSASSVGAYGEPDSSPMTMEAELTKHQLKEQEQEIQDLKIQLETKVNYYERELELMKTNFEKERKDTEQCFKMEISELEEQKADLEKLDSKYQEVINGLKEQLPKSTQQEMEKRFEKERAEMEQYYAKEISTLGQRLNNEREQLEAELRRQHLHEMQAMREKAEEERNQKLAEIEARQAECSQSLMQQHQREKQEILQKHELDKNGLMIQWKKEHLKQQETHNEEQARICKIFAIEKEGIENNYKMQIDRLNDEIESLNARLVEEQRRLCTMEKTETILNFVVKRPADHNRINGQPFPKALPGSVCATEMDQEDMQKMADMDNIIEPVLKEQNLKQIESQNISSHQVLASLKVAEERLALLEKTEESTALKHQETEKLVSTLRAQLQDETKAREMLLREQKGFEVEQAQLIQLRAREQEWLQSEATEQERMSEMLESSHSIQKQESKLHLLTREKEELEKQVAVFEERSVELQNRIHLMRENQHKLAAIKTQTQPKVCKSEDKNVAVENTALVDELVERNALLTLQLRNLEEELSTLHIHLSQTVCPFQEKQEDMTEQVQGAREEFEMEKNVLKAKLFHLEDIVLELEKEARASEDERIELRRLSEDNSLLRNQVEQLQQEVCSFEDVNRKQVTELNITKDEILKDLKEMTSQHHEELKLLDAQRLQLSGTVAELSAQNMENQETIQQINSRLSEVTQQKEEIASEMETLQEKLTSLEQEKVQQHFAWERTREQLGHELQMCREENQKYRDELGQLDAQRLQLSATVSGLRAHGAGNQETIQQINSRLSEVTQQKEEIASEVETLQEKLTSLEQEKIQQHSAWERTREQLGHELQMCREELLETNTKMALEQSQHMREVQHLKETLSNAVSKEQLSQLENKLKEEKKKVQQLQDNLRFHAEQTNRQLAVQQEEHLRVLRRMNERMEEAELKLKNVRIVFQEKVNQLEEQLEKKTRRDLLLKDLYVESADLRKALQDARRENHLLQDNIRTLNSAMDTSAPMDFIV